jgi:hypothetical protein
MGHPCRDLRGWRGLFPGSRDALGIELTERERPEPENRPGFFLPAETAAGCTADPRHKKTVSLRPAGCYFFPLWFEYLKMQYRGKDYIVVQGIEPDSWKWTVDLDEQTSKSGEAKTRGLAVSAVVLLVDRLLTRKSRSSAA